MKNIFDRMAYIREADDDEDINTDFTDNTDDEEVEENPEEPTEDESTGGDTDFTNLGDDNEDSNDEEPEEDDGSSDEDIDDEYSDEEDTGEEEKDVKSMENELYEELSPFEISTRNTELKDSYVSLYDFINEFLLRIQDIKKSNTNIKILEYCEDKLISTKSLVYNHIVRNFTTNSYITNQIMYKQYLFIISKISDLMKKISTEDKTN